MSVSLISVIIPVYNAASFLEKCLNSIVCQTYKDLEVIVVDDGSNDSSPDIINNFLEKDCRFYAVTQTNQGVSEARNCGIDRSSGDYICFVDSDDWVPVDYIEKLFSGIAEADLVATSYTRVYESRHQPRVLGWAGLYPSHMFKRRLLGPYQNELAYPSQLDSMVPVHCKLYRSDIIKNNKLRFTSTKLIGTGEDFLFNLQYVDLIDYVLVIDEPLYFYRKNNCNSITTLYKSELFEMWLARHRLMADQVSISSTEEITALNNRLALSIIGLCLNEASNPAGGRQMRLNFKKILNDEKYREALNQLDFSFFPIHWKIFFGSAKKNNVRALIFLSRVMHWILYRRSG